MARIIYENGVAVEELAPGQYRPRPDLSLVIDPARAAAANYLNTQTEQVKRRSRGVPWGHVVRVVLAGAVVWLVDFTALGWSRTLWDNLLWFGGGTLVAEALTHTPAAVTLVVDAIGYHLERIKLAQIRLERYQQWHATRRAMEYRLRAEAEADKAHGMARAVEAGKMSQVDREQANRIHRNRRLLLEMLLATYDNYGNNYQGHQPFAKKRIGGWYDVLVRIGAIVPRGSQPQWNWSFAETAEAALDKVLKLAPELAAIDPPEG